MAQLNGNSDSKFTEEKVNGYICLFNCQFRTRKLSDKSLSDDFFDISSKLLSKVVPSKSEIRSYFEVLFAIFKVCDMVTCMNHEDWFKNF